MSISRMRLEEIATKFKDLLLEYEVPEDIIEEEIELTKEEKKWLGMAVEENSYYEVHITANLEKYIYVQAKDEYEAKEKAEKLYQNNEIDLGDYYHQVSFEVDDEPMCKNTALAKSSYYGSVISEEECDT